jgi:hypothetical protein
MAENRPKQNTPFKNITTTANNQSSKPNENKQPTLDLTAKPKLSNGRPQSSVKELELENKLRLME